MIRPTLLAALACLFVLSPFACGGGGGGEPGFGFVDATGDGGAPADGGGDGGVDARRDGDGGSGPDTGPSVCDVDGARCDDGDPCTLDDRCAGGTCVGDRMSCDDRDPCTDDGCDPTVGGCIHVPGSAATCDDGDPCTTSDRCADGVCLGTPDPACACDTAADCAEHEDGDRCNGALFCDGGRCRVDPATVVTCQDDPAPCKTVACDPATGLCGGANEVDGTPCDDGTVCFLQSTCQGGECVGAALECDDGVPCTRDTCSNLTGCHHIPLDEACDDDNGCTNDACDMALGCAHTNNADACDDGDPSTTGDRCQGGVCRGEGTDCDDGSPCTVDSVDPTDGHCVHDAPAANGTACDDHDPDTSGDQCTDGLCVGQAGPCGGAGCDDGDPCTDDACVAGACRHTDNAAACDDGVFCTTNDRCQDGVCAGDPENCGACTADFGDAVSKVTELAVGMNGQEGNALDIDGDPATCAPTGICSGGRDNAFAAIAAIANPQITAVLESGELVILLALPSWPPPAGDFAVNLFVDASLAPESAGCDPLDAGCTWVLSPTQVDADCGAVSRFGGVTYAARHLSGGGPGSRLALILTTSTFGTVRIPVDDARIEADVQVVSQNDIRLDGVIGGAVPTDDPTIAALAAMTGITPDLDQDGDGIAESLSIGLPFRSLPAAIAPRVCVPDYCFATGAAACPDVIDCVAACDNADDPCKVACFEQGEFVAQQRYLALGTCVQDHCPQPTETCIQGNCWDELNECYLGG